MIKKYKEIFENQEELDWEEEPDETDMIIIGWEGWDEHHTSDYLFILQEEVDEHKIIFYKDYYFTNYLENSEVNKHYRYLRKDELDKYVYNDTVKIHIFNEIGDKDINLYWSELSQNLKDQLC